MPLNVVAFVIVESTWFDKHMTGRADSSDVVQQTGQMQTLGPLVRVAEFASDRGNAVTVPARAGVSRFECSNELLDRSSEQLFLFAKQCRVVSMRR